MISPFLLKAFTMGKLVPLSRSLHSTKTWARPTSYAFAARDTLVPVAALELSRLAAEMPLAFVQNGDQYILSALLSVQPGRNLFVGPDGRWLVNTIPAVYRAYPFRLARTPGTEQMSVCVDEDGGLIRDAGAGEAFFSPEGEISTSLKPLVELLKAIENGRASLEQAGRALAQAGLLVPWDIKLRVGERDLEVKGAWRVDEGRLRALDDAAFLALRQDGALGIAYAQMLSMNRVEVLARLADWHQKVDQQLAAKSPKNFDQLLQNAKGTLKF